MEGKRKRTVEERLAFAARLRAARAALGLTRRQAAEIWGINRRSLEGWEIGRELPAHRYWGLSPIHIINGIINEVEAAQREGRRRAVWVGGPGG